jgi:type IV pilus assembly protein PilW
MNADRRSRAHTLLEVLIAMVVGLLVLAAGALYHAQRVAHGRAEDAFAMRDAATTALMLIGQQIQMAGFRSLDDDDALPLPPLFGCSAARVRGDGAQVRCEAAREASDAVVVRYVGDGVDLANHWRPGIRLSRAGYRCPRRAAAGGKPLRCACQPVDR